MTMASKTKISRAHKATLIGFLLFFMLPASIGFTDKLLLFWKTVRSSDEGSFAAIPVINYLIVFAGMACLLVWAIANGMFSDIEAPKYTMLDNERRLDECDGISWDKR
jgi:nitrogen fixation-related uncharacterized protein